jgi:hypothetical protein
MVLAVNDLTRWSTTAAHRLSLTHPVGASEVFLRGDFAGAFVAGPARCLQCRMRAGQEAANAAAKCDDEATVRLPQAELLLSEATQPEEITRSIVAGDVRIPVTTYQRAWSKLVAAEVLPPTHELVVVEQVKRAFTRVAHVESGRDPAWKVPDDWCWIDMNGVCWPCSTASTNVFAVALGVMPTFRGSQLLPDPRVEGVRKIYDRDLVQLKTVDAIKRIVASP